MPRSRVLFLLILGAAIVVVIGLQIFRSTQPALPTATPRPPLEVEVAVNPLLYDWATEAAQSFNARQIEIEGQPARVRVTSVDGIGVIRGNAGWSIANHPTAWIPEASFLISYAAESNWRFSVENPSLASTYLVWGIFQDRLDVLTTASPTIDWALFQQSAPKSWSDLGGSANWGFVKPAFPRPSQSLVGFAVMLSGSAAFHQKETLSDADLTNSAFQKWLQPVVDAVPSFATLGIQPGSVIGARGASVADFALLPESEFVQHYSAINTKGQFRFFYPAYTFKFDFPVVIWDSANLTAAQHGAVSQFVNALTQTDAQQRLLAKGFRPAKVALTTANAPQFGALVNAGLTLEAPKSLLVQPASRSSGLSLLTWFDGFRSRP